MSPEAVFFERAAWYDTTSGGIKKPKALLPWVESTWRGGGDNRGLDEQTYRITQISRS